MSIVARAFLSLLFLCSLWAVAADKRPPKASHFPPALSIGWQDLHHGIGTAPVAFDIAPDGSRLAVEFWVLEDAPPNTSVEIWLAVWDLSTKQQLQAAPVDGPFTTHELENPQIRYDVRFSPDSHLVVQTGLRVRVLTADGLQPIYSIAPSEDLSKTKYGPVIRNFSLSSDARRIAVLSDSLVENRPRSAITVLDLLSGERLYTWNTEPHISQVTLSPDGNVVLLNELSANRLTARSSADGKVLHSWNENLEPPVFTSATELAGMPSIRTDAS
jgi:hypothetical protein